MSRTDRTARRPAARRRLLLAASLACSLAGGLPATAAAKLDWPGFYASTPGAAGPLAMAPGADGSTHYVYTRPGVGLVTRSRTAVGALSVERTVAPDGHGLKVAADAAGNLHFVWLTASGADTLARTRRLSADGTLGPVVDLSSAGFSAYAPALAVGADGTVTYAWTRTIAGGSLVQARRRTAAGVLGAVQNVSAVATGTDDPSLAVDHDGAVLLAWGSTTQSGRAVRMRRWNADGTFGPVTDLSTAGGAPRDPRVVVDAAGAAHFTWTLNPGGRARVLPRGGALGPVEDLDGPSSDSAKDVRVAADPTGGVQYVWRATGFGADQHMWTRRRAADGNAGTPQKLGAFAEPSGQVHGPEPEIGVDAAGVAYVAWRTATPAGNAYAVYVATRHADGTLENLWTLGLQDPVQSPPTPRIVVAKGTAIVGWLDDGTLRGARALPEPVDAPEPMTSAKPGPKPTADPQPAVEPAAQPAADTREVPPPPPPVAADVLAPQVARLGVRATRVRPGGRLDVRVALSEGATVRLVVRRRGSRRDALVHTAAGQPGLNRVPLALRARGRRLAAGAYELHVTATDRAGNRSLLRRVRFTVAKGS